MSEKSTIQDIARRAGVGAGTVSRVLNDHPHVSEATREKVLAVIAEMDYRPSFLARQLRTQRSRLIGFLTDEIATTPYAGEIILGAQAVSRQHDHILLIASVGDDRAAERDAIDAMLERQVEGIIYSAVFHRAVDLPDSIYDVPVVLANCFVEDRSLPSAVPDEVTAGRQATEILLAKGHRRVGFINVHHVSPGIPASIGRLEGYQQALAAYDVTYDSDLVRSGTGDPAGGYEHTLELMKLSHPPTALFCGNDRTAMGAYDALRELGLRIPDDMAVIGFDNMEVIAGSLHPGLSTMQLPHYEMGAWAADYLIESATNDHAHEAEQQTIPCPYVERQSI